MKNYKNQEKVFNYTTDQILTNSNIVGLILDFNLTEGNQILNDPSKLQYGVSITDGCIDFNLTGKLILEFYNKLL